MVSVNSIIIVLICSITVSSTALSATIPEIKGTAQKLDTSNVRNPRHYHVVTLPSTNMQRVDGMCLKFLSLIPKAMLIPSTAERTVYRLVANTYDTIESAKKCKSKLAQHCESPFVEKNNKGYSVIAGSQLTEALAVAEQKRLARNNISTMILELRLPLKQWQMKSTECYSIRDAVTVAGKLAKIGVITTIEQTAD